VVLIAQGLIDQMVKVLTSKGPRVQILYLFLKLKKNTLFFYILMLVVERLYRVVFQKKTLCKYVIVQRVQIC